MVWVGVLIVRDSQGGAVHEFEDYTPVRSLAQNMSGRLSVWEGFNCRTG